MDPISINLPISVPNIVTGKYFGLTQESKNIGIHNRKLSWDKENKKIFLKYSKQTTYAIPPKTHWNMHNVGCQVMLVRHRIFTLKPIHLNCVTP